MDLFNIQLIKADWSFIKFYSSRETLFCGNYGEKRFEIFQQDFKTFQYVQKYPLSRAHGEASLRKANSLHGNSPVKQLHDLAKT